MNKPFNHPLDAVLRSDFASFARKVFGELNPGAKFDDNWHLEALFHELELARTGNTKRLIVNVPPRSLKSICFSVALPAYILGHNPSARMICVSYAQLLAAKMSRDFRKVINSAWYKRVFPNTVVLKDTEDEIETTMGGGRFATSVGGVMTGFGADYIILDDPMKPEEAWSETSRERVIRFYRGTLTARLNSKLEGVIILVMQRLHADDLAGYLLREQPARWTHLKLPAINDADRLIQLGAGRVHT